MAVNVLIPVHDRLKMTSRVIECLRVQHLDEALKIIVIDDGSTDGTAEYLATQPDITVINGDGSLWWGGAIDQGLKFVLENSDDNDWVLLINDDTRFDVDFVQNLLDVARSFTPAAVGSVICEEGKQDELLSIGGIIDNWRLRVSDKLESKRKQNPDLGPHNVDVLSGRGTLYPLSAIRAAGAMKPKCMPQYYADYELSIRVKKEGYKLLVSEKAITISEDDFGNARTFRTLREKLFSVASAYYLPGLVCFWWQASTFLQKLTLFPRLLFVGRKLLRGYLR